MSQKVYVLDKNKNPLMPTTRFGRVRILLKQNKARVVSNKPFTIQLLYDGEFETQDVILGIACSILNDINISLTDIYTIKQYRRHDRQACHKENLSRNYYFNGKKVATNRHKAECQTIDSLEEFRTKHSEQDISKLTVKHIPVQYKDIHRTMPGALFLDTNTKEICVLKRTDGKHNGIPDYYVDEYLNKHLYNKCIILQQNQGLRVL